MLSLILIVLFIILTLNSLKVYKKNYRIAKYVDQLPGVKWYPLIGTAYQFIWTKKEALFDVLTIRHSKFGPVFRNWYGSTAIVNIYKPEHVKEILGNSSLTAKGTGYRFFRGWLGDGLITGNGSIWKAHRRIITPSFHFSVLDCYGEIFVEKAEQFIKYLDRYAGKGFFDISEDLTHVSLDIITEAAMGVKLNSLESQDEECIKYSNAINENTWAVVQRLANLFYQNDFVFNFTKLGKECYKNQIFINNFNRTVIKRKKKNFDAKSFEEEVNDFGMKRKICFLDLLLVYQQKNALTDLEIEDEVSTFMFAGFDTTIATISNTLMQLGNHPEVLKRVHEELDSIFADDKTRKVTAKDIAEMVYLEMVIKEVLRESSFIAYIQRRLEKDVEIDGHIIPKDCLVNICLYNLHHDSDHYADPHKFDPERFSPQNSIGRHPYAFIPFSAGPRNCLGQKFAMRNVKTLLAYILRKFNVICAEKPEDIKYYMAIISRPQNNIHIAFEARR